MDQVSYPRLPQLDIQSLTGCFVFLITWIVVRNVVPSWLTTGGIKLITPSHPGQVDDQITVTQFIGKHVVSLIEGFKPSWWLPK